MTIANYIIPLALCLPALLITVLLLLDSNSTLTSSVVEVKKIRNVLIVGIMQSIVYCTEYILYEYSFFELRRLGMLIESILYICNMLYILFFADLIYSKYQKKLYKRNINKFIFFLPVLIMSILEFLNIFIPIFFNITTETFEYVETPWVMIVNIVPLLYVGYSGIYDIKEWRENSIYFNLPLSLYLIITVIGIVLESFFIHFPIIQIACAISMMIMYLRVVKRVGYIDTLSGLYTRSSLPQYITSQLNKLSSDEMLVGIMLDVNHFKKINDNYGHVVGDRAISAMGDILRRVVKKNGACFRFGGDEFIIVLKLKDAKQVDELMNKIDEATNEFNSKKEDVFELSVAKGYAIYDNENASIVKFVDKMDFEMYKNKKLL